MAPRFQAAAALALVPWLGAVPTGAASVIKTERFPSTPVVAADTLLWTHYTSSGTVGLWSAVPGSAPREVQLSPAPFRNGSAGYLSAELAASPSLALVTTTANEEDRGGPNIGPTSFRYHVGPSAGPLEEIGECRRAEFPVGLATADVWGEAYVYRQCDRDAGHVEIRDTADPPLSPARSAGRGGLGARIAGRYVAWREGPYDDSPGSSYDIVVYDRAAGAELYRIPRSELRNVVALDVQEDGKVAFALAGREDRREEVGWASPEEPSVHLLPLPPRGEYALRMVNDRIAFQSGDAAGAATFEDAEVGVSDLNGASKLLARRTTALSSAESFDYDGERLVWRELGCYYWRLHVRSTDGPTRSSGDRCRLRLRAQPVVRHKFAIFEFECAPLEHPCWFDASLRLVGHGGKPVGKVSARRNPVRIKLRRVARRLLERDGSLRVRAKVTGYGEALPFDTFRQVRRGTVRLRAR